MNSNNLSPTQTPGLHETLIPKDFVSYARPHLSLRYSDPSFASHHPTSPEYSPFLDSHAPDKFLSPSTDTDLEAKLSSRTRHPSIFRRRIWSKSSILIFLSLTGWVIALIVILIHKKPPYTSQPFYSPNLTPPPQKSNYSFPSSLSLDDILSGQFAPTYQDIRWSTGMNHEDGTYLVTSTSSDKDYLSLHNIRPSLNNISHVLMRRNGFVYDNQFYFAEKNWPSPNTQNVLLASDVKSVWRHSFKAFYWIINVKSEQVEPLDPNHPTTPIQLAIWSPTSDAIAFVRNGNLFIRNLSPSPSNSSSSVLQLTFDNNPNILNGIPDWVYEEDVISTNTALWWSPNGKSLAFLRTNDSKVSTYPLNYFLSHPSDKTINPNNKNYPDVINVKYPIPGSPNPSVELYLANITDQSIYTLPHQGAFPPDNRIINNVIWAGDKLLSQETDREGTIYHVILTDPLTKSSKIVRNVNYGTLDGGWVEPGPSLKFVPKDEERGRNADGYIDMVVWNDFNHIGYFTPLDNPNYILLTKGEWEVETHSVTVDLQKNIVFFLATKDGSTQRHAYRTTLSNNNSPIVPITNTSSPGFYDISFSANRNFALLYYKGPNVPWQKVISINNEGEVNVEKILETNHRLSSKLANYKLPQKTYGQITVDGIKLNYLERRPVNFNPEKKYPVLFFQYQGPGSQTVRHTFEMDFNEYAAINLGFIVVSVDGRGTGYMGRHFRNVVRGKLGYWEAHDQIAAAKLWASKGYVDPKKMVIWGWSYGGYSTLKTLEIDAGQTFNYGIAVAPVTDWQYYDSVYAERYMFMPNHNPLGYLDASISHVNRLKANTRFLLMHGSSDDNVHIEHTYALMDKLHSGDVLNFDLMLYPDSNHNIHFHNDYTALYKRMEEWLIHVKEGLWEDD